MDTEKEIEERIQLFQDINACIDKYEDALELASKQEEFCATTCKGYQQSGRCYVDGRCEAFRNHFSKII